MVKQYLASEYTLMMGSRMHALPASDFCFCLEGIKSARGVENIAWLPPFPSPEPSSDTAIRQNLRILLNTQLTKLQLTNQCGQTR